MKARLFKLISSSLGNFPKFLLKFWCNFRKLCWAWDDLLSNHLLQLCCLDRKADRLQQCFLLIEHLSQTFFIRVIPPQKMQKTEGCAPGPSPATISLVERAFESAFLPPGDPAPRETENPGLRTKLVRSSGDVLA